jgi:hypothetical protein
MKNNIFLLLLLLAILLNGCATTETVTYLPKRDFVGKETNGSMIFLRSRQADFIEGELIAVENDSVYILTKSQFTPCGKLKAVAKTDIAGYTLRFADSKNYSWTIPVFTIISLTHGLFAIVSLPINWMVTGSLSSAANRSATYTMSRLKIDDLYSFSRFPQGIPSEVDKTALRLNLPQCTGN